MGSHLEYIYKQYVDLSDGLSDKEEYSDETVMMQVSLKTRSVRRSMFSISRAQSRAIEFSTTTGRAGI